MRKKRYVPELSRSSGPTLPLQRVLATVDQRCGAPRRSQDFCRSGSPTNPQRRGLHQPEKRVERPIRYVAQDHGSRRCSSHLAQPCVGVGHDVNHPARIGEPGCAVTDRDTRDVGNEQVNVQQPESLSASRRRRDGGCVDVERREPKRRERARELDDVVAIALADGEDPGTCRQNDEFTGDQRLAAQHHLSIGHTFGTMARDIEGRRILITGGAGFIGSHLVERLAARNTLVVFDTLRRNALARLGPLPPSVTIVEGDVMDRAVLSRAASGCDLVIHLAAIAGTRSVDVDATRTLLVNFLGTSHVLDAAADAHAERCVVLSTSEVYGIDADGPSEDDPTPIPAATHGRWAYAASKLLAEHLAMASHRSGRVATVVVRPFNVYGPRQVGEGAIHDMIEAAISGRPVVVRGDGRSLRAWCYVSDFVSGLVSASVVPDARGEIFNLGDPSSVVTVRELADMVAVPTGATVAIEPATGPDVRVRRPAIEKAQRMLGFKPRVPLREGIERTIAWRRSLPA